MIISLLVFWCFMYCKLIVDILEIVLFDIGFIKCINRVLFRYNCHVFFNTNVFLLNFKTIKTNGSTVLSG
jgi:hypothetical protein